MQISNPKEMIKHLRSHGWALDRVNGGHHILKKDSEMISIPVHGNYSLGKNFIHNILKKAGLK